MTKPKPGSSREYQRKRMQRIKADPKLYAAYLAKKSKRNAAYYARLKQDPERYAEYKRKVQETARARYARRKAERGETALKARRERMRKYWERLKAEDPARYEAYLANKREYNAASYANLKSDPERYDAIMRRQEETSRRRYEAIKADPVRYAEYLRKARERARALYAKRKAAGGKS